MASSSSSGRQLLFTPGPLTTSASVKAAMLEDVGSRDAKLVESVRQSRAALVRLANGGGTHDAVFVQGSGTFGVESVIASHFGGPRAAGAGALRKPLVLVNGSYGKRIVEMIRRYRGVPEMVVVEYPEPVQVSPTQLAELLAADHAITDVITVHSETTTGIINDIDAIGQVINSARAAGGFPRDICYIVDSMSAFGCYDVDVAKSGIDFVVSSANKNLQGVPGFAFVIGSKRRIADCKGRSPSLSLDLHDQAVALNSAKGQFRYTPPTHVLLAFAQALVEFEAEGGAPARLARYKDNHEMLCAGMGKFGFVQLLPPSVQGCIITTYLSPTDPNWDFEAFYAMLADRGCIIYPGKLAQADSFRIGCIGDLHRVDIQRLVDAVGVALKTLGVTNTGSALGPSTDPIPGQLKRVDLASML